MIKGIIVLLNIGILNCLCGWAQAAWQRPSRLRRQKRIVENWSLARQSCVRNISLTWVMGKGFCRIHLRAIERWWWLSSWLPTFLWVVNSGPERKTWITSIPRTVGFRILKIYKNSIWKKVYCDIIYDVLETNSYTALLRLFTVDNLLRLNYGVVPSFQQHNKKLNILWQEESWRCLLCLLLF